MHQPVDTHLNTRATSAILQTIDPLSIDLGHFDEHRRSVSYRIHPSTRASLRHTTIRSAARPLESECVGATDCEPNRVLTALP
jgi:hypothetical protein